MGFGYFLQNFLITDFSLWRAAVQYNIVGCHILRTHDFVVCAAATLFIPITVFSFFKKDNFLHTERLKVHYTVNKA